MSDEIRMSNDELPIGWAQSKIGNLCSLKNGRAFKPTEWTTSGLPIVRIQNLNNPKSSYNHFAGEPEPRYHLLGGELLFAWSGTPGTSFGAHVWRGAEAVLNQHIFRVDFDTENMDKRFFRYAINQKLDELIDVAHGGVGLRHVTKGTFEGTEIKVPPLAEQKRIADKLEAVLGRVDACRARLDRVPALLKRFRQSVLASATSGKLTAEWRMTNGVNDEWEELQLKDVATQVFDGPFGSNLKTADYTDSGIRVARLENIGWMTFIADKEAFISPTKYQTLTRHTLKADDVMFSSFISEEIRVAMLPNSWSGKAINKSDCFCVRADIKRCLPKFLMHRLACRSTFAILGEGIHGATRPRINLSQLKGFAIALPPLPEQQEIVRRVEALFAFADRIEGRLATAQKTVERLTPATLAKAFRGELVPQDPSDEPASALLERIRDDPESGAKQARKIFAERIKH